MSREAASTVVAGEIIGPHGIAGEVKLKSHVVSIELMEGMEVFLRGADGTLLPKRLIKVRQGPKGLLLTIEGVSDRNSATELRGVLVEVDASLLPSLEEGEYYWDDIIGLEVFTKEGERLGSVIQMLERVEQDLLIVDVGGRETMVPFVEPIVISVDVEGGRIVIDPPEGLLELDGS